MIVCFKTVSCPMFFSEREHVATMKQRVAEVEELNAELRNDMDACARREAEHLEFTRRVSDKHALGQSELSGLSTRLEQLDAEHRVLSEKHSTLVTSHDATVSNGFVWITQRIL